MYSDDVRHNRKNHRESYLNKRYQWFKISQDESTEEDEPRRRRLASIWKPSDDDDDEDEDEERKIRRLPIQQQHDTIMTQIYKSMFEGTDQSTLVLVDTIEKPIDGNLKNTKQLRSFNSANHIDKPKRDTNNGRMVQWNPDSSLYNFFIVHHGH